MKKLPIGTFINMGTVIIGSLIGLMLQQVFPESIETNCHPGRRTRYFDHWAPDESQGTGIPNRYFYLQPDDRRDHRRDDWHQGFSGWICGCDEG